MAKSNKPKWIIGLTGTALSAFVLSQVIPNESTKDINEPSNIITKSMSKQEKELVLLDWTNYNINGVTISRDGGQSDRNTRRS